MSEWFEQFRCTPHTPQPPQTVSQGWAAGRNTRIDLREKVGQLNVDYGAAAEHEMASS